jgi:hypothetical protein
MFGLDTRESALLRGLSSPRKVQDYLDTLPINHEKGGETCFSPRRLMRERKAHCLEGALFAAAAFKFHRIRPLLMNFKTTDEDQDHAVTLFRINDHWGAISKTNHAILRWRDPIYRTPRELALSYFHEYFMFQTGKKTLRGYSRPFSLSRFDDAWITMEEDLWHIADALADAPHTAFIPAGSERHVRPATAFEYRTVEAVEWPESDPRT